jgi:hypothetical protein
MVQHSTKRLVFTCFQLLKAHAGFSRDLSTRTYAAAVAAGAAAVHHHPHHYPPRRAMLYVPGEKTETEAFCKHMQRSGQVEKQLWAIRDQLLGSKRSCVYCWQADHKHAAYMQELLSES